MTEHLLVADAVVADRGDRQAPAVAQGQGQAPRGVGLGQGLAEGDTPEGGHDLGQTHPGWGKQINSPLQQAVQRGFGALHKLGYSVQAAQLLHALAKCMFDSFSFVAVLELSFDGLPGPLICSES